MTISNDELFNKIIELQSELYDLKCENRELKDMMNSLNLKENYISDVVAEHDKKFIDLEKFIKMGKKLTELEKDFSDGT